MSGMGASAGVMPTRHATFAAGGGTTEEFVIMQTIDSTNQRRKAVKKNKGKGLIITAARSDRITMTRHVVLGNFIYVSFTLHICVFCLLVNMDAVC
jgi:hypothetical protein